MSCKKVQPTLILHVLKNRITGDCTVPLQLKVLETNIPNSWNLPHNKPIMNVCLKRPSLYFHSSHLTAVHYNLNETRRHTAGDLRDFKLTARLICL